MANVGGNVASLKNLKSVADYVKGNYYTKQKVDSLIGAPLVAHTASEMTDHDKIYIYTGSETGYSNGHWYYYYGSSWQDGGVYNAVAVDTDKTLSVENKAADAKKTGDELSSLKSDLTHVFSDDAKFALVDVLQNLVYTTPNANDYYESFVSALFVAEYPKITAVFNPGTHNVYQGDNLDTLRPYLTITYYESEGSTGNVVTTYTLNGELTEGTQTIVVSYHGCRTSFAVIVTNPFIYRLPNTPVELDGTIGIDTGVELLSENRSFTIAFEFEDLRRYDQDPVQNYLFGCYISSSPYTGIFVQQYDGGEQSAGRMVRHVLRCTPPGTSGGQVIYDSILPASQLYGRVVRVCFSYDSTNSTVKSKLSVNGVELTPSVENISYTFTAISASLIIGARKGSATMANFVKGIYNEFKVFDYALSDSEMMDYIEGVSV